MFKHSVLALAATASVLTVAIPEQADARTRHHRVSQERIWRGSDGRYHCRRGDYLAPKQPACCQSASRGYRAHRAGNRRR